jgi:hypothetical protein
MDHPNGPCRMTYRITLSPSSRSYLRTLVFRDLYMDHAELHLLWYGGFSDLAHSKLPSCCDNLSALVATVVFDIYCWMRVEALRGAREDRWWVQDLENVRPAPLSIDSPNHLLVHMPRPCRYVLPLTCLFAILEFLLIGDTMMWTACRPLLYESWHCCIDAARQTRRQALRHILMPYNWFKTHRLLIHAWSKTLIYETH